MDDNGSKNNLNPGANPAAQPVNQPQYVQQPYRQPVQQPQYQQPQYQQPQYQQPQYQQPQYGQPQYQQPQYQQPQYQQPQYQQPQYGQPQYPPQGYEQKPKKKKKWIIPVAIVAALIVICGAAALIVLNRPAALVGRAASNTANAILASELFDTADEVSNGGSVEMNVDLSRMSSELIGFPMTIEGDIKMFADRGKSKSAIEITFEALGTTIDAGVYMDGKEFAVNSDFLLDGNAYGIDLSQAYDAIEDSVFGPGGEYELDSDVYEAVRQMLKAYSKENTNDELMDIYKDGAKTAKEYVSFVVKTVLKYADIEKSSTKLSIGGQKVKVTDVTLELDSEALGTIIEAVMRKAADDKELKSVLDSLCDYLESTYPEIDDFGYLSDGIEEFYEEIDDILDNIDNIKDELEDDDTSLSLDFYINGKTQLIGVLVEPEEDDYSIPVKLLYGPDAAAPDEISLLVGEKGDEMSLRYIVSDSDDDDYSASFSYSTWGREQLGGSVNYDKKSGDYDLSIGNNYGGVTLYGNMEKTKDGYVFSFDGLRGDDIPDAVNTIASGVKLRVRPKDTMPKLPDYTDILKMSDKQIEDLAEDIYGEVMDLVRGMW